MYLSDSINYYPNSKPVSVPTPKHAPPPSSAGLATDHVGIPDIKARWETAERKVVRLTEQVAQLTATIDLVLSDQSKVGDQFKVGDVVRLKSGGPKMVIEYLFTNGLGQLMCGCSWHCRRDVKVKSAHLNACTLRVCGR